MLTLNATIDTLWALKSLHGIAVALNGLHKIDVAHQDVKPSNVLYFTDDETSKIGDVGRASSLSTVSQYDLCEFAGDRNYSPFEQLYGLIDNDWRKRRFSCDLFMFGNLLMTYFNGVSINTSTFTNLDDRLRPHNWGDEYCHVLPYVETAFNQAVDEFATLPDENLRREMKQMVIELCHPDPERRGNDKKSGLYKYSLDRYISRFDYWYHRYAYRIKKGEI